MGVSPDNKSILRLTKTCYNKKKYLAGPYMKKFALILSLSVILTACGDFQWLPEPVEIPILTPATFTDKCPVNVNEDVVSTEEITVTGITKPVQVTIKDGEYSLNSGTTWKSDTTEISSGQKIKVRTKVTADDTLVIVRLAVGAVNATFRVRSGACMQNTPN